MPMPTPRAAFARLFACLVLAIVAVAASCAAALRVDSLARAIHERSAVLRTTVSRDPMWTDLLPGGRSVMAQAESALARGDRELALERLAEAWSDLEAVRYLIARPALQRKQMNAFEAEWKRQGTELHAALAPPSAHALDGVTPAAVRAQGEAALPQIHDFYDASLDYGRSTSPDAGLFYLGSARAQRAFVELCRDLSERSPRRAPSVRSLHGELDALEDALLAAYRPPASIDLHPRFIEASSALKEARELDETGLQYGALLRYLLAVQLASRVRGGPPSMSAGELAARLQELRARLAAGDVDHSIGAMFLQRAAEDFASAPPESAHATASAIVTQVLPAYFAALEPASPGPPKPPAELTVTLVRWPYT